MKKIILFLSIIILLIVSCGLAPNYTEDDWVIIKGKILNPDGTVYANKEIGMWIVSLEGLSLSNYWYLDPDDWEKTDENGNFEFERKGSTFITGNSTDYVVIANLDSIEGPVVSVGFYPYELVNEIPEIKLWDGNPTSSASGGNVSFDWDEINVEDLGDPDNYILSVRKVYYDLWRSEFEGNINTYSIASYVFQNFASGWRVTAKFPAEDRLTDIAYDYHSSVKAGSYPSTDPVLLSAGKPCYIEGKGDTSFTKITNQVWHEWEWLFSDEVEYFIIDLEQEETVNAVAVYGLSGSNVESGTGFNVFVASDTLNWGSEAASTNETEGYFVIDNIDAVGRYVKLALKDDSDLNINLIKEISVFGE